MGLRFFMVPVVNSDASEQELNGFLASHKVVSIERKLIDQGGNSFWAICIDYLSHVPRDGISKSNLSRSRVDYKAILPPDEFAVYSQLRDMRKELAQSEGVPVYALFTNEQLAQMVQRRTNNNGFRLALNSDGSLLDDLRIWTEQIIFQSEQAAAWSAKSKPEAAACW